MTNTEINQLRTLYIKWLSTRPNDEYELELNFHHFVELVSLIETIIINKPFNDYE